MTLRLRGNDGVLETSRSAALSLATAAVYASASASATSARIWGGASRTTALNATGSVMSPSRVAAPPPATQARKRLPRIPAFVSASCAA